MVSSNIVPIIQARMTSTRLPGKVLEDVGGRPVLAHVVERVSRVSSLAPCVIATTANQTDDPVADLAERLGIACFRGSENNVLSRYVGAAEMVDADAILRITADCPLIDPETIGRVVQAFADTGADYVANTLVRTYPIGMDAEVFSRDTLAQAAAQARAPEELEHVTLHIYRNPERFDLRNVAAPNELARPDLRLTVDTPEDLKLIRAVFEGLEPAIPTFGLADVIAFLNTRPDLAALNKDVRHNWMAV